MGVWDSIFGAVFGRRRSSTTSPPPPPPPRPAPPPPPRPAPPAPPAAPPAPPPAAPPAPPPASPPAAPPPPPATPPAPPPPATPPAPPPPAPPAPSGPPQGFAIETLRAQNAARLTDAEVVAAAQRLGVDANVLRAVIKVESAGPGFSDGRPLLSFEPFWFSQATQGRFDSSNPAISQPSSRAYIGGNQASRWSRLSEAYGLDPAAALGAASWGAFQLPGRYYADAGYANVFQFVQDMSQSEARQLAAFEAYLTRRELADELQRHDWAAFARAYEGEAGSGAYATALARAYDALAAATPAPSDGYIDSLVAGTRDRITAADIAAVAQTLGCEPAAVKAVLDVESGPAGAYGADGRPTILYEPHIFSRRTSHQFDGSNPNVSYPSWGDKPYPREQTGRWAQLREAYGLNPEVAMMSASYGLFQIMGFNHAACGYTSAKAFVTAMCTSEAKQLEAFAAFIKANHLDDELRRKDWEGFAGGYNGTGQIPRYARLLQEAYERARPATS